MRLFTYLTSIFLITLLKFTKCCLYTICSSSRKFWWVQSAMFWCNNSIFWKFQSLLFMSIFIHYNVKNCPVFSVGMFGYFIYMKTLQECSSIIWLECSIFNSLETIFLNKDVYVSSYISSQLSYVCLVLVIYFLLDWFQKLWMALHITKNGTDMVSKTWCGLVSFHKWWSICQ